MAVRVFPSPLRAENVLLCVLSCCWQEVAQCSCVPAARRGVDGAVASPALLVAERTSSATGFSLALQGKRRVVLRSAAGLNAPAGKQLDCQSLALESALFLDKIKKRSWSFLFRFIIGRKKTLKK